MPPLADQIPFGMIFAAGWYAAASIATLAAFAIDKRRAASPRAGRARLSEKSLHVLELMGGWPGALTAMALIRHKNRKPRYHLVTWAIALLHGVGWAIVFWVR